MVNRTSPSVRVDSAFRDVLMTKADLAKVVYERHGGLSNREASELVDAILNFIKKRLVRGEKVQITGFGTFSIRTKRGRRGRNPQTGKEIAILPRKAVVFRPSKALQSEPISHRHWGRWGSSVKETMDPT